MTLSSLNTLSDETFVETLAGIFEHSPWVAEGVVAQRPFDSVGDLHASMVAVVRQAPLTEQLSLIRAHPDLAGRAARAGDLTQASSQEQAGAGLTQLSDEEYGTFMRLNTAYMTRFGFPFILAVKGHTKHSILAAFQSRLDNDAETERETALAEIYKIAHFRLQELLSHGS
jgi:2-oxo-4-hydroxy-4-carboxy-5-ureidoimidazoline decarboxylase